MGSTGSGNFTDYSNYSKAVPGVTGGADSFDRCSRGFTVFLEDVETCDYYLKNGTIPSKNTPVVIDFDKRVVAKDSGSGTIIGFLPTEYNYLRICIQSGYSYSGIVNLIIDASIKSVSIAVTPSKDE